MILGDLVISFLFFLFNGRDFNKKEEDTFDGCYIQSYNAYSYEA
jgi:hypothetical protein